MTKIKPNDKYVEVEVVVLPFQKKGGDVTASSSFVICIYFYLFLVDFKSLDNVVKKFS